MKPSSLKPTGKPRLSTIGSISYKDLKRRHFLRDTIEDELETIPRKAKKVKMPDLQSQDKSQPRRSSTKEKSMSDIAAKNKPNLTPEPAKEAKDDKGDKKDVAPANPNAVNEAILEALNKLTQSIEKNNLNTEAMIVTNRDIIKKVTEDKTSPPPPLPNQGETNWDQNQIQPDEPQVKQLQDQFASFTKKNDKLCLTALGEQLANDLDEAKGVTSDAIANKNFLKTMNENVNSLEIKTNKLETQVVLLQNNAEKTKQHYK